MPIASRETAADHQPYAFENEAMLFVRVSARTLMCVYLCWSYSMLCCSPVWAKLWNLYHAKGIDGDPVSSACGPSAPWVGPSVLGPPWPWVSPGSLAPARSLPLALGLGPGPGFRLCWCLFFGLAQGAALQYAACKPSICVLMLLLEPRVCVAHAGFYS